MPGRRLCHGDVKTALSLSEKVRHVKCDKSRPTKDVSGSVLNSYLDVDTLDLAKLYPVCKNIYKLVKDHQQPIPLCQECVDQVSNSTDVKKRTPKSAVNSQKIIHATDGFRQPFF